MSRNNSVSAPRRGPCPLPRRLRWPSASCYEGEEGIARGVRQLSCLVGRKTIASPQPLGGRACSCNALVAHRLDREEGAARWASIGTAPGLQAITMALVLALAHRWRLLIEVIAWWWVARMGRSFFSWSADEPAILDRVAILCCTIAVIGHLAAVHQRRVIGKAIAAIADARS